VSGATFLDLAQDLMVDAGAKAAFDADPDGFLAARGFDGLSPADVGDAVGFVADTLPADAARQLTDPDAGGEGLVRLARLEPIDVATEAEPALPEHDPSGELDLGDDGDASDDGDGSAGLDPPGQGDPMAADLGDDDLDPDPVAVHHLADDDGGIDRLDESESEPEPGFGVGWEPGDADDVTAASPEFANVLEHPADLDMDVTHVPDLALGATDPIGEAIAWADHEETAAQHAEALEHDAGHDAVPDDGTGDHHHDGDHDGHLDF